jgi:hypothetical protein
MTDDNGLKALKDAAAQLHECVALIRADPAKPFVIPPISIDDTGWNFKTFSIYISQRFSDLSLQLQQRFEAQQTGLSTAMAAAEKAVIAALTAAEKAVDKAEQAQGLRNVAQNEFRESLSDLSKLMWTIKEGSEALAGLRREIEIRFGSLETNVNHLNIQSANLQGRLATIGIVWGVIVIVASAAIRWFH